MISIKQNYQVTIEIIIDLEVQFFKSFYPWIYPCVYSYFLFFPRSYPLLFHISLRSHVLLSSYIYLYFLSLSEFLFLLIQFEKQLFSFFSCFPFSIYSLLLIKIFVARTPTLSLAQFGRPNFPSALLKTLILIKISKFIEFLLPRIYIYI